MLLEVLEDVLQMWFLDVELGALFWDERHGQGFSVLFLNEARELSAGMHF